MAQVVSQSRPDPKIADGSYGVLDQRYTGYKEQFMYLMNNKLYTLADEGSYYVATNPTPGSGVLGGVVTTMDNTKPFILIKNNGSKRIYLDFIKLMASAIGATGSLNYATHIVDAGAGYTSGGSTIAPVQPNCDIGNMNSAALIYTGAVVATAGPAQRIIGNQAIRSVITVIYDTLYFQFGGEITSFSGMPIEGLLILERAVCLAPVIIGPQESYKLVLWRASQAAGNNYEFEIGYWER
jgi:hypothetical protein